MTEEESCCLLCMKKGKLKKCSACQSAWYCSRECQKSDWLRHKTQECKELQKKRQAIIEGALNGLNPDDFELYKKQAIETENCEYQVIVGICYEYGFGIETNMNEAIKWYRLAAEQNFAQAQHNLGNCYASGDHLPLDNSIAFKWYYKAAELGLAESQNKVGYFYANGIGVPINTSKCLTWFRKSAAQGFPVAQRNLAECYGDGKCGITINNKESIMWYKKAAEQGDINSQYNLGFYLDNNKNKN